MIWSKYEQLPKHIKTCTAGIPGIAVGGENKMAKYKLVNCCCCSKKIYPDENYKTGTIYHAKYWCIECWLKMKYCVKGL